MVKTGTIGSKVNLVYSFDMIKGVLASKSMFVLLLTHLKIGLMEKKNFGVGCTINTWLFLGINKNECTY